MNESIRSSLSMYFLEALEQCINSHKSKQKEKVSILEKFQETGKIPSEVWGCMEKINVKPIYTSTLGGHKYIKVPMEEIARLNLIEEITPYSYIDWDDPLGVPVYLESDVDANTYMDRLETRGIPVHLTDHGEIPHEEFEALSNYTKDVGYYFAHYERDFDDLLDIHKASKSEDEKSSILKIIEDKFGAKKPTIVNSD